MNYRSERLGNVVIGIILGTICLLMVYPLIYILSSSISDPAEVYAGNVRLLPVGLSIEPYVRVFKNENILRGYGNTIFYTFVGTSISIAVSFMAAYPLSRKDMSGRKFFMTLFIITMFFSGGLVPLYIVINTLGMNDTIWGFILPGSVSVWNIIVIRTYMSSSIPFELQESAMMDGAKTFALFFRIILPLSKPILAVMVLFYLVGYWNSYFNALIFISDEAKYPLQMILRSILIEQDLTSMIGGGGGSQENMYNQAMLGESLKYSSIVVSTLPVLFVYPFIAKYFEKGMLVGSLKG
jgi:putative aldouronate transport system permease protein